MARKRKRSRVTVEELPDDGEGEGAAPLAAQAPPAGEGGERSSEEDEGPVEDQRRRDEEEDSADDSEEGEEEGDYAHSFSSDGGEGDFDSSDDSGDQGDDDELDRLDAADAADAAETVRRRLLLTVAASALLSARAHPRLAAGRQGPIVDLNVEFFDPTEPDFHAVKMLLNEYLPKQDVQSWAQSALVELILAQVRQPPPCAPILAGR